MLKREQMIGRDELLLFDILHELKCIRQALENKENKQLKENKTCQHCGESHEKPVQYAICARKHKKEE